MYIPGRHEASGSYRYGFQGQEKDDEIKGEGNSINFSFRMYDSRIGKFLTNDPLTKKYPHNSPYAFSENRVIDGVELEGLEFYFTADGKFLGKYGKSNEILVQNNTEINKFINNKLIEVVDKNPLWDSYEKESTPLFVSISEVSDEIKSNIYTTIYERETGKHKYKLKNNAIGVGSYLKGNLKEPHGAGAQNVVDEKSGTSQIHFWSTGDTDYYAIANVIYHEHMHAFYGVDLGYGHTGGALETLIYWEEIDNDKIFKELPKNSQNRERGKFLHYLGKLYDATSKSNFSEKDDPFIKYKNLYEKKFDTKIETFSSGSSGTVFQDPKLNSNETK